MIKTFGGIEMFCLLCNKIVNYRKLSDTMPELKRKECFACEAVFPTWYKVYTDPQGTQVRLTTGDTDVLVFVLDGAIALLDGMQYPEYTIEKGKFFLKPMGRVRDMRILQDRTRVLACHFNANSINCIRHFLDRLVPYRGNSPQEGVGVLPTHPLLEEQLRSGLKMFENRYYCNHFYEIKLEELFIYLNELYSKRELCNVFYPLLGGDPDFKNFVLMNYRKTDKVNQLSNMIGMTPVTFNRRFVDAFGISAATWLRDRRKESIIRDIKLTRISFTKLSSKYGFSSPAYFTAFCRRNWEKTPKELRAESSSDK